MKKLVALLLAALAVAALLAGCSKEPNTVVDYQLTDPPQDLYGEQTEEDLESFPEEESDSSEEYPSGEDPALPGEEEATDAGPETVISYVYVTSQQGNTAKTTPTKAPTAPTAANGPGAGTAANTQAPAVTTKTTTKPTTKTTTGTTKKYANPISIGGKDAALSAFNSAIGKVIDKKVGFGKSHKVTYKDWNFDDAMLEGIPVIPGLGGYGDPATYLSGALNTALHNGVRSATQHSGDTTKLMKKPTWTSADIKDITYSGKSGGNWTVTVTINNGETRQKKALLGQNITGNSPIDRGPLNLATGDGNIYDHMRADNIFALIKNSLSLINADPIDVIENTSQVKFVATLDGEGSLIKLVSTYNQQINIKEIQILGGANTYTDNVGSATVTVTYDSFDY